MHAKASHFQFHHCAQRCSDHFRVPSAPILDHHRHRGRRTHAPDRHHRSSGACSRCLVGLAGLWRRCTAAGLAGRRRSGEVLGGFLRGLLLGGRRCVHWGWRDRRRVWGTLADRSLHDGKSGFVHVGFLRAWFHFVLHYRLNQRLA